MVIPKGAKLITAFLIVGFTVAVLLNGWISDDAYITFRTVQHLVEGRGAVWNVGERVQAYTHPLWMLLVALPIFVTREYFYTVIALSVALSMATALLVGYSVARQPISAWTALIILLLSSSFLDYSTSGLENSASHLLLAGFLVLFIRGPRPSQSNGCWLFWLALIASLGAVNRLDILLIYLPLLAAAWWQSKRWRDALAIGLGLLPLALWELFSLFYYGFLVPNTAYAKLNTGITHIELLHQGLRYLLESASLDPLGAIAIGAGLVAALWLGIGRFRWTAVSILLYLLYIVYIGGDFMAGRFLTPLILLSAILLAATLDGVHLEYRYVGAGFFALAGLTALLVANPLGGKGPEPPAPSAAGIADERAVYLAQNGLLTASLQDRLIRSGRLQGTPKEETIVDCGGVGLRAFQASPYTRVVDTCGLSDALLARLPAKHTNEWRIGHFRRALPDGYLQSLASGENAISDPDLAKLYDALNAITRAPLFAPSRLQEIWRMNTGRYDSLVDQDRYLYPDAVRLSLADAMQGVEQPMTGGGVYLDSQELVHPRYVTLGLACDTLDIVYATSDRQSLHQSVDTPSLRFADTNRLWIVVPENATEQGVQSMHVLPGLCTEPVLHAVDMVQDVSTMSLAQALDMAHYIVYRGQGRARDILLDQLVERVDKAEASEWKALPFGAVLDALRMPHVPLRDIVRERVPNSERITNQEGVPVLRYLGAIEDPEDDGVELDLYFEPLLPPTPRYEVEVRFAAEGEPAQVETVRLQPDTNRADGLHKASVDLPTSLTETDAELCVVTREEVPPLLFESTNDVCIPLEVE